MTGDLVFLDSNGLIALLNSGDWLHNEATERFAELNQARRSFVTTNLVLAEAGNGLARTDGRVVFSVSARKMLDDPRYDVVFVDRTLFLRGITRYRERRDKAWGLIDCISFEVMRAARVTDAFTADRHFEQAGLKCLLRGSK